jgi:hypothetical protein
MKILKDLHILVGMLLVLVIAVLEFWKIVSWLSTH